MIPAKIEAGAFKGGIEYFPESERGFAFPQRRAYHKASAERHWERLFEIFARTLQHGT